MTPSPHFFQTLYIHLAMLGGTAVLACGYYTVFWLLDRRPRAPTPKHSSEVCLEPPAAVPAAVPEPSPSYHPNAVYIEHNGELRRGHTELACGSTQGYVTAQGFSQKMTPKSSEYLAFTSATMLPPSSLNIVNLASSPALKCQYTVEYLLAKRPAPPPRRSGRAKVLEILAYTTRLRRPRLGLAALLTQAVADMELFLKRQPALGISLAAFYGYSTAPFDNGIHYVRPYAKAVEQAMLLCVLVTKLHGAAQQIAVDLALAFCYSHWRQPTANFPRSRARDHLTLWGQHPYVLGRARIIQLLTNLFLLLPAISGGHRDVCVSRLVLVLLSCCETLLCGEVEQFMLILSRAAECAVRGSIRTHLLDALRKLLQPHKACRGVCREASFQVARTALEAGMRGEPSEENAAQHLLRVLMDVDTRFAGWYPEGVSSAEPQTPGGFIGR